MSLLMGALLVATAAHAEPKPSETHGSTAGAAVDGIVPPYPLRWILRGFSKCRRGVHTHQAIDIAGVGPQRGLGEPIRSMVRARVVRVGRSTEDPELFGQPDRRPGKALRGRRELPRSKVIEGYGRVFFFTRSYGRWRSGTVVITEGVGGRLDGHEIRYMHLGAARTDLEPGRILEAGEQLGVMGGTAVQETTPHVHVDVTAPSGERVDVAALFDLPQTAKPCQAPSEEDEP